MSLARQIIEAETPKGVFRRFAAKFDDRDLEDFLNGYIDAALWSSHDDRYPDGDDNLEGETLAPETLKKMKEDCHDFLLNHYHLIANAGEGYAQSLPCAGQDFWLSRCGHGTGFFDGGYGPSGRALQDAARVYGNVDLYVGDDGLVYQ